jgi:4-hydroxy-tetrahydrodipicolinate reductase
MGRTVADLLAGDSAFQLVGGLDRDEVAGREGPGGLPLASLADAAEVLAETDVVIDFSAPAFLSRLLDQYGDVLAGRALVVGTTGLDAAGEAALDRVAARSAVLRAANFSVGVNLLAALVEQAAAVLGPEFDVEIVEAHHRRKEDAPSGTALALGEAVAAGRQVSLEDTRRDGRSGRPGKRPEGEIGFHALRGGDVIGEHTVHFIGDMERIELTHKAADRRLFAAGALRAAAWMAGREPGRYSMREVLGL